MAVIDPRVRPELYQRLVEENLYRQALLLRDMFSVSQQTSFRLDLQAISALHFTATMFLVERPGAYRRDRAYITYRPDLSFPETEDEIRVDMVRFSHALLASWDEKDAFELAAFALWTINRIHPFEDGNGRTARAAAQHILHVKHKRWLPGRVLVAKLIEEHPDEYRNALRHADETDEEGAVDLLPLSEFLAKMLELQLNSAS